MAAGSGSRYHLEVRRHVLANGLTVLLHEDHRLPQVAVNLWYHVGSKDEAPGKTGFAHLFEHLMFQGSEHSPGEYFRPLEEVGGQLNGSTAEDRTNYWEVVPAAYLERALWLESDRMGWLLPALDQAKLDNQREVVKNERRQTMENEPYGAAEEPLLEVLSPEGHPYRHSIIGSVADLDGATLEDVRRFFRRFYTPNNASLCLAGDLEPEAALALVEKHFGPVAPGPVVSPVRPWQPRLAKPVRVRVEDRVQLPRLYLQWPSGLQLTAEDAAFSVLAYVLGTGKDSRFVKRLQVDASLAQAVTAYQGGGEVAGAFCAILTAHPGVELARVEEAAWEEIRRLREEGPAPEEVRAAVDWVKARVVRRLQTLGGFGGVADLLNYYQTFRGEPDGLGWDLGRYEAVTPEAVRSAAARLDPERYTAVSVVPKAERPAAGDRSRMPGPGSPGRFRLDSPARQILPNGLEVWVVPRHEVPYVTVKAVVRAGAGEDPEQAPGTAQLAADLLDEAAAGMGPSELARRAKGLATALATSVNRESAAFTLGLLPEHVAGGLGLLADVLLRPEFRPQDFERLREAQRADLQRLLDSPSDLGSLALRAALFGGGSPYGHLLKGTPASLRAMALDPVRAWYAARYRPDRALVVVVGAMAAGEALDAVHGAFGEWAPAADPAPGLAAPAFVSRGGLYLEDVPGAPQSQLMVGAPSVGREAPEYPAVLILNEVLSGQFTSRINMNLREEKGYTYGAQSFFMYQAGPLPWVLSTAVQTDKTAESLKEIRSELEAARGARPVSPEEFEAARSSWVLRFPQRFETQEQVAESFGAAWVHRLGADYFGRVLAGVEEVTLEAVRCAARLLDLERAAWVVAGDAAVVREPLASLGLGPAEGVLAPVLSEPG